MTATNATQFRTQPPEFRQYEVKEIFDRWRAGESISLVGVGSVGKSNLMQHLANPVIQARFLKEIDAEKFRVIMIDPNLLGPLPKSNSDLEQVGTWLGYELMLHRLYMAFQEASILDARDKKKLSEIYAVLQDVSNPMYAYMGLRYFELGLDVLLSKEARIVFMFDEFEAMLRKLPVSFFLTLRGLRDAYKKQLSYLTFTRVPLPAIMKENNINPLEIEEFVELFTDNTMFLGPYNEIDARRMVNDLCKRNKKEYHDYAKEFLVWSSGGFAGLLRASFRMLENLGDMDISGIMTNSDEYVKKLSQMRPVRAECETIWLSLSATEREVLRAAAGLSTFRIDAHAEATEYLVQKKRLLKYSSGNIEIVPPIFHYFVSDSGFEALSDMPPVIESADWTGVNTMEATAYLFGLDQLTPGGLMEHVGPFLQALVDIEAVIAKLRGHTYVEPRLNYMVQETAVTISLDGVQNAMNLTTSLIKPWRRTHAESLIRLRAAMQGVEPGQTTETLKIERQKISFELKRELFDRIQEFVRRQPSNLQPERQLDYVHRLLGHLEVIGASRLELEIVPEAEQ